MNTADSFLDVVLKKVMSDDDHYLWGSFKSLGIIGIFHLMACDEVCGYSINRKCKVDP